MTQHCSVGVIGGSGLYHMDGLTDTKEHHIQTPFGLPSDAIVTGLLDGVAVAFLTRHGRGHTLTPNEIPFLAHIWALKSLGVRYLISVSAVGSLHEDARPLDAVLPDQFIDMTHVRPRTFFGQGIVAHVSLADPVCAALRGILFQAAQSEGFGRGKVINGGTYVCIEGPQFSTRAESRFYQKMGATIIGMSNMPEARLAREAEIAYATLALVTDYDCWKEQEAAVTAEMAIGNLMENVANAQRVIREAVALLDRLPPISAAHSALASALVTPLVAMPPERIAQLGPILAKYL